MKPIKALGTSDIKALGLSNTNGMDSSQKKSISIRYVSCSKDEVLIYLQFEINSKNLSSSEASIYVDEIDTISNDIAVPKTKISILKTGVKRITLSFDKNKNFTESFFDDGNIFQATITCDELSAKSYEFKLNFKKQIKKEIDSWKTVAPIIHKEKFIGWAYPNVKKNCFDYSWEEMKKNGFEIVAPSWKDYTSGKPKISKGIYQIYLSNDLLEYGLKKGVQADQFKNGLDYLIKAVGNNIPVLVGIDDDKKYANPDQTTDHFVLIIGMGTDSKGNYFLFHDNAVNYTNIDVGCSAENKLYCDMGKKMIIGMADKRNTYANTAPRTGVYIVTQIRETKKK